MLHILETDFFEIMYPTRERTLLLTNIAGIPYFYGIASFMFEGTAVQLDIY
jgi:hypothetical protein